MLLNRMTERLDSRLSGIINRVGETIFQNNLMGMKANMMGSPLSKCHQLNGVLKGTIFQQVKSLTLEMVNLILNLLVGEVI